VVRSCISWNNLYCTGVGSRVWNEEKLVVDDGVELELDIL